MHWRFEWLNHLSLVSMTFDEWIMSHNIDEAAMFTIANVLSIYVYTAEQSVNMINIRVCGWFNHTEFIKNVGRWNNISILQNNICIAEECI